MPSDAAPELRAIVADDDPTMRELVGDALTRSGFRVIPASTGERVLAVLRDQPAELLVTDVRMPGMNGLDLVQSVRELSPSTSCILITGDTSLETARGAARTGAVDYLPKPFTEQDLLKAVQFALRRRDEDRARSREQELSELFRLSQDARQVEDPWEMLRVTTTTAVSQTGSDIAYLGVVRDGKLVAFSVGEGAGDMAGDTEVSDGHLLRLAAESETPILYTALGDGHPLSGGVRQVAPREARTAPGMAEALAFPLWDGIRNCGAVMVGRFGDAEPFARGDFQLLSVLSAQCGLLLRNANLVESLQRAYLGTVQAMARTLEARDPYTHGHSQRVASICRHVAEHLGLSPGDAETLELAAGLHDVGKVAIPDAVLHKPGSLTAEEWSAVRMHPVIGAEVLTPAPFLQDALPLVLHHHERYDGKGYPDGLMSSQLSDLTHIIMAADAYDAMTSNRPYRAALTTEQALSELEAGRGAQFSPAVVDAMQELVDRLGAGV